MFESFITLITATLLLLGSPGPAPIALAATGATFGTQKGLPFLFGILLGLGFAIVGATVGLAALFSQFPALRVVFQFAGGGYMLYVAYKIATASVLAQQDAQSAPSFRDGFILNLLNPKVYAAFLAIFSQFLLPFSDVYVSYLVTGLTCFMIAVIVDVFWLMCGSLLRPIFAKPAQARVIRVGFAISIVVAVIYALF